MKKLFVVFAFGSLLAACDATQPATDWCAIAHNHYAEHIRKNGFALDTIKAADADKAFDFDKWRCDGVARVNENMIVARWTFGIRQGTREGNLIGIFAGGSMLSVRSEFIRDLDGNWIERDH
jgi:hypothetical protein